MKSFAAKTFTAYGIDPALRHGAVVIITATAPWNIVRDKPQIMWTLLYTWGNKYHPGVKTGSDLNLILSLSKRVSGSLCTYPGLRGGVDYTYETIFWRSSKMSLVTMAIFIGMLYAQLNYQHNPPIMLSTKTVYSFFGMKPGSTKQDLHRTFLNTVELVNSPKIGSDELDAIILAYISGHISTDI